MLGDDRPWERSPVLFEPLAQPEPEEPEGPAALDPTGSPNGHVPGLKLVAEAEPGGSLERHKGSLAPLVRQFDRVAGAADRVRPVGVRKFMRTLQDLDEEGEATL